MAFLDDVKVFLGLTDNTYDPILTLVSAAVLEAADDFMGIKFTRNEAVEERFDGGKKTYYLAYANVSDLTVYVDQEEAILGEDYTFNEPRGVLKFYGVTVEGSEIVVVTYRGGYLEASYPKGLWLRLIKQAAYEFRRRKDPGLSALTFPDGTVNKFAMDEWLPDVEKALARHRRFYI